MNQLTAILRECEQRGITLRVDSGNLICEPATWLTPHLIQNLKQQKPALLKHLSAEPDSHTSPATKTKQRKGTPNSHIAKPFLQELEELLEVPLESLPFEAEPVRTLEKEWENLREDDQRLLDHPQRFPQCRDCGMRSIHAEHCPPQRLPIGKHKGKRIRDQSTRYLSHFLAVDPKISPDVKTEIQRELWIRGNEPELRNGRPIPLRDDQQLR